MGLFRLVEGIQMGRSGLNLRGSVDSATRLRPELSTMQGDDSLAQDEAEACP